MGKNTRKALYKAITWRVISTSLTFALVYLWFGSLKTAGVYAIFESVIKFVAYYIHELAYQGRLKNVQHDKEF